MATFKEANQARLSLKMKLSQYSWYSNSEVAPDTDGYLVVINVLQLNNQIRKIIPSVVSNITIKTELA